jgi:hypothetical protein
MAARSGFGARRILHALGMVLLPSACWAAAPLEFDVSTSKPQVRPGEALYYNVTARNTTPAAVTLGFGSSIQAQVNIDGEGWVPNVGLDVITSATIPANGSRTWRFREWWSDPHLRLGPHEVMGRVLRFEPVGPARFEVVAPTYPTQDFLIDFDKVPGTADRITSITELWPYGVHFSSRFDPNGSGANYLTPTPGIYGLRDGIVNGASDSGVSGNQFCGVMATTYPPGFNIVADFDMPVFGATVDVGSAAGRTVTMVAKDTAGEVIASATSTPVSQYMEFVGPLHIETHRPIATLEWWPSSKNATVLLDNLHVDVTPNPEPSSAMVLGGCAYAAMLARRRVTV